MLSERRRLSDVATCCSASGDVMHCAGTADHSTHEGTLDTGSTATDRPADIVKNASDSQVVLLYSAGSSFVFENRKRQSGSSEEAKHGSRLRYVGIPQPREPRTPPARRLHTRQLNHASHIAPPPRPPRQNPRTNVHFSLFLTKRCRLCAGFVVGIAYHLNADTQPPEGTIQFVAQQNPPPATNAREYGTLFVILTARLRKSCRRCAKNRLFGYRTVFTREFTTKPKATACDGPR